MTSFAACRRSNGSSQSRRRLSALSYTLKGRGRCNVSPSLSLAFPLEQQVPQCGNRQLLVGSWQLAAWRSILLADFRMRHLVKSNDTQSEAHTHTHTLAQQDRCAACFKFSICSTEASPDWPRFTARRRRLPLDLASA